MPRYLPVIAGCFLLLLAPRARPQTPTVVPDSSVEVWQVGEWIHTYAELFGTSHDWALSYPLDGPVFGPGLVSGHLANGAAFTLDVTWFEPLPPLSDQGSGAYTMGSLITERSTESVAGVIVHVNSGGPPSDFFVLWQRAQDPFGREANVGDDIPCPPIAPCNGLIDGKCVDEACGKFQERVGTARKNFQEAIDQAKSEYARATNAAAFTYTVTLVACVSALGWWTSLFSGGTSIAACIVGASIMAGREQIKATAAYQIAYNAAKDAYGKAIEDAIDKFYADTAACCRPYPPPKSGPQKRG